MDARGLASLALIDGAVRGSMDILAEWTMQADKVIVY
jgi:sulfur relay (sulfurtransferase) complex TusBCD TusD component (DsrE family)